MSMDPSPSRRKVVLPAVTLALIAFCGQSKVFAQDPVCCDRGDGIPICVEQTDCDGLDLGGPCFPVGEPCEQPQDELVCCELLAGLLLGSCTPAAACPPELAGGPCPAGSGEGEQCEVPLVCCELEPGLPFGLHGCVEGR